MQFDDAPKNPPGCFFSKAKQSPNAAALDAAEMLHRAVGEENSGCLLGGWAPHLVSGYLRGLQALIELFITRLTQLKGLTITVVAGPKMGMILKVAATFV